MHYFRFFSVLCLGLAGQCFYVSRSDASSFPKLVILNKWVESRKESAHTSFADWFNEHALAVARPYVPQPPKKHGFVDDAGNFSTEKARLVLEAGKRYKDFLEFFNEFVDAFQDTVGEVARVQEFVKELRDTEGLTGANLEDMLMPTKNPKKSLKT